MSDNEASKFERQMDANANEVPDSVEVALINQKTTLEKERIKEGLEQQKMRTDKEIAKIGNRKINES